jgi:hypothetical protein
MTERNDEQLLEVIKARCYQDSGKTKLNCSDALALAKELGIDSLAIAGICNRHDIRIATCQLGCFK